jgi:hypothetical protein
MCILARGHLDQPIDVKDRITAALRSMSVEELRHLGLERVAYLRTGLAKGEPALALYGADGVPIAIANTLDGVLEKAAELGLGLINVH